MSVYKEIKTEFKTGTSLMKALRDLGVKYENTLNLKSNTIETVDYHGNVFSVAISVDKQEIAKRTGYKGFHAWGGIGFRWNGGSYDMVIDNLDQDKGPIKDIVNTIKQRYTYHEVKRQALAKGYAVKETKDDSGVIRLQLRSLK